MKRNYVFIIEQRWKRTWYPWAYGGDTKREAELNLAEVKECNPCGKDEFRLRKYEAVS